MEIKPLPDCFFHRNTVIVAQELLGKTIVRNLNGTMLTGIITETEAYSGTDDPACHAYRGITPRTAPMFGPVGHTYVYFIYGNHYCLNLVARDENQKAGAVLIRSIIPLIGKEHMRLLRGNPKEKHLTDGPGKLCQALGLTRKHNNIDVTIGSYLYITEGIIANSADIIQTPRIGISKAQDKLWRFVLQTRKQNKTT